MHLKDNEADETKNMDTALYLAIQKLLSKVGKKMTFVHEDKIL